MTSKRCVVCGEPISAARIAAALARGKTPQYDTDRCANTAAVRRYRAAHTAAPIKPKRKKH